MSTAPIWDNLSPFLRTVALGDFVIPQRGIFAVGQAVFEPFAEGRHLAVLSRATDAVVGS